MPPELIDLAFHQNQPRMLSVSLEVLRIGSSFIYIYQYNSINNKYSRHLWIFCIMDFFGFFWILFFILPAVPNMALCPGDCLCDNTRLVVNCTNVYLPDMPITLNPHIKVSYLLELKSDLQILFRRYCWRYLSEKNLRLENSDQY